METVERDARGEYTVYTVVDADGNSLELVKRDCGDYFEVTPRRMFLSRDGVTLTQGVEGSSHPVNPNNLLLSFPGGVVMKLPKNLPQDMTERMKIVDQVRDEAAQKLISYLNVAYKKSASMSSKPDEVEEVTTEVKKLSEEVKDVLKLH